MIIKINGIKAWITILVFIVITIAVLALIFHIVLFLIPVIIVIFILSYLFRMLNKVKKGKPKDYIDIEFKEKNEPLSINQFQNVQGNNCR
jgi:hypothetical protein